MRSVRAAAIIAVLALAACGGGSGGGSPSSTQMPEARPSSTAKLSIISPKDGEMFHSSNVPVKLQLKDAVVVKPTTTHIVPNKGHIHLLLDEQIVSMNYQLDDVLHNVKPGAHVLQVEFVASDHRPFDPRVISAVTFQVKS